MVTTHRLECLGHFLGEKQTQLYKLYYLGVSQLKMAWVPRTASENKLGLILEYVVRRLCGKSVIE